MPEGKVKLSTLSDHPTKYSCQKLTSRYLSLSAWFSAGHEHCTLLNTTYKVGVPVITDQPVGWLCQPLWNLLNCKVSQKARLVSCVQVGVMCRIPSPAQFWAYQEAAGRWQHKSFPDAWYVPKSHGFDKRGGCDKVDRFFLCRFWSVDTIIVWCCAFRAGAGSVSASTQGWV